MRSFLLLSARSDGKNVIFSYTEARKPLIFLGFYLSKIFIVGIERAVPLPVLMSVLGHKDVETTINIYNEVQKEYKQREMIKLEDFFDD